MRQALTNPSTYVIAYVILINLLAFAVTGIDKHRARRGKTKIRVPEATLILLALAGGAAGEFCAMLIFRHKTKHPLFFIGVPLILLLQVALAIYLIFFTP